MIGVQGFICPADQGQVCMAGLENPQYGYQGFDNFAQNTLLVFQVCDGRVCSHTMACGLPWTSNRASAGRAQECWM